MADETKKPTTLDDLSKAKLKVTIRNMNDVADMNPLIAESMKVAIDSVRSSLKKVTVDEAVADVVESVELLKADPERFAEDFSIALFTSLDTRAKERAATAEEKAKADAAAK